MSHWSSGIPIVKRAQLGMSVAQVMVNSILTCNEVNHAHDEKSQKRKSKKKKSKSQRPRKETAGLGIGDQVHSEQQAEAAAVPALFKFGEPSLKQEQPSVGGVSDIVEDLRPGTAYHQHPPSLVVKAEISANLQSDHSESSDGEEGQSKMVQEKLKKVRSSGCRANDEALLESFLDRQLKRSLVNRNPEIDSEQVEISLQYVDQLKANLLQRGKDKRVKNKTARTMLMNQIQAQQVRLVHELTQIQNEANKHIFNKMSRRNQEIQSYIEKRKCQKKICSQIKQIQEIEIIKCGQNPFLNVKKSDPDNRFALFKQVDYLKELTEPVPVVTMSHLKSHPQERLEELIKEQGELKASACKSVENLQELKESLRDLNRVQGMLSKENSDELRFLKSELQEQARVKFEAKQQALAKEQEDLVKSRSSDLLTDETTKAEAVEPKNQDLGLPVMPKSLSEVEDNIEPLFKIDPTDYYAGLIRPKTKAIRANAQAEVKRMPLKTNLKSDQTIEVPDAELISQAEEFSLEMGLDDYRRVKDELYLQEEDRFFQNEADLEALVKEEEQHITDPTIDFSLMKLLKLDDQARKYLEQKYYRNAISGLIGKIFDIDDSKIDPQLMPGQARCRYCNVLFASWRIKRRHEMELICVKSEGFTLVNRKHLQQQGNHELVWGDQILLHSCMSIDTINFQFSRFVGNIVSRKIEPFDRTEVLQTATEWFVYYHLLKRVDKLLKAKILSQQFQIPFSEILLDSDDPFTVVDDLSDERCVSFRLGEELFGRNLVRRDNIFATPNFLQNFDFFGGYEEIILECKVKYAGLQLGIILLNEIDEISQFLWWRQEAMMEDYKYQQDFLDYRCFFGIYHETQEYPSPQQIYLLSFHREPLRYRYEFKKCPFFVRYRRTDPSDKASPYVLSEFDLTHSHPLGLHIFEYADVSDLHSLKRRSKNEYTVYEKTEIRINRRELE